MSASATCRITKTPEVCGGSACIAGHRLPVWILVGHRQLGATDAEIYEAYPWLQAADLEAAGDYYAEHREEIENDIRENEDDGE